MEKETIERLEKQLGKDITKEQKQFLNKLEENINYLSTLKGTKEVIFYTKSAWRRDGFDNCISCGKNCNKGVLVINKIWKVKMPFCFNCYNQVPDDMLEIIPIVTLLRQKNKTPFY